MSSDPARSLFDRIKKEAEAGGYLLNPDVDFVLDLMEGLVTNQQRYGYLACPCRLADGSREEDLDIICPCDYRDPDLEEYGACYCALYVSPAVAKGEKKTGPVPERRGTDDSQPVGPSDQPSSRFAAGTQPVWRCKVCGYLCARPAPPLKCPICKADQDRFEKFS
jgi:ferredoxin-thioredoxin reductase catalytic chain